MRTHEESAGDNVKLVSVKVPEVGGSRRSAARVLRLSGSLPGERVSMSVVNPATA